jgi:hypothetical protein
MQSAWEGLMLAFSASAGPVKTVIDGVASILTWITNLVTGKERLHSAITATVKAAVYLTTVDAAYRADLKLQVLWNTRLATAITATGARLAAKHLLLRLASAELAKHNLFIAATRSPVLLWNAASGLLAGNLTRARAAMHLFNLILKANPVGLVLSLVAAAVVAFQQWIGKTRELTAAQKITNEIQERQNELIKQYSDTILREKTDLNALVAAIVNINDNGTSEYCKKRIATLENEVKMAWTCKTK